jgi:hypothetical protein
MSQARGWKGRRGKRRGQRDGAAECQSPLCSDPQALTGARRRRTHTPAPRRPWPPRRPRHTVRAPPAPARWTAAMPGRFPQQEQWPRNWPWRRFVFVFFWLVFRLSPQPAQDVGGTEGADIRDREMESLLRRDSGMLALSKDHPRSGDSVLGCGGLLLRGGSEDRCHFTVLRLAASFGAATSTVAGRMTCSV